MSSDIQWQTPAGADYSDILYQQAEGIAKITINRPEVRNAFRPETVAVDLSPDERNSRLVDLNRDGKQDLRAGGLEVLSTGLNLAELDLHGGEGRGRADVDRPPGGHRFATRPGG